LKGKFLEFYQIKIEWVLQAQEYHNNLAKLLIEVTKELNVEPDKILNKIKSWSEPEELRRKKE